MYGYARHGCATQVALAVCGLRAGQRGGLGGGDGCASSAVHDGAPSPAVWLRALGGADGRATSLPVGSRGVPWLDAMYLMLSQ